MIPVTTIGGYLGSGKTTLVNHLLRNADGLRLAVLVNEFGALPIDEDLIEAQGDDLISIAGGCICCSFGDDLTGALNDIRHLPSPPDHILIESSGVAIPGAITASLGLLEGLKPDGTIVLVDAETIQTQIQNEYIGDTIERQLSDADIIVVNKADLIDESQSAALKKDLLAHAPVATLLTATYGRLAPALLLGSVTEPKSGHESVHADALFSSQAFEITHKIDATAFAQSLANHPLVRAKGFVLDETGRATAFHVVGKRWTVEPAVGKPNLGFVCIGYKGQLDVDQLKGLIESF